MKCPRCGKDVEMLKFTTTGIMCRRCHGEPRPPKQHQEALIACALLALGVIVVSGAWALWQLFEIIFRNL